LENLKVISEIVPHQRSGVIKARLFIKMLKNKNYPDALAHVLSFVLSVQAE
jgi:hypothetical protein